MKQYILIAMLACGIQVQKMLTLQEEIKQ